ncbi:btb kelch-domain containing protein [Volepox virus]|uniref:Btb kelch-domain containing protein n=1 Tax=Volepox virus TaxID=28874 RepID=A0A1C9KCL4_9POXV|nr:btb kelch-domain containing protein [Volepox virus]AOP31866.1 btb kelch-domain containing protein [Volepox virus]
MNHSDALISIINEFRKKRRFCDVIIVVNDERIDAHRIILSGASEYFSILFSSNFIDSDNYEVNLSHLDYQCINELINYIYGVPLTLTNDNVKYILSTADFLQISSAIKECEKFILGNLCSRNCIDVYMYAIEYNNKKIETACFDIILQNILLLINNENFKHLTEESMIKILRDDRLNIKNEDFSPLILIKWLECTQNPCSVELLRCLRITLLSPQIIKALYNHHLIKSQDECLTFLNNISFLEETFPRYNSIALISIGIGRSHDNISINCYNNKKNTWDMISARRFRCNFAVAVLDNIVYMMGGHGDSLYRMSQVIAYDIRNNSWIYDIPSLKYPRSNCRGLTDDEYIYCIGGIRGHHLSFVSDIDRWKPSKPYWQSYAKMREKKCDMGVVMLNGLIYIIGGIIKDNTCTNSVESLSEDGWTIHQPLPIKMSNMATTVHAGKIYISGGYDNTNNIINGQSNLVFSYDPIYDEWTKLSSLNIPRINPALWSSNNKIYVCGGISDDIRTGMSESYDEEKDCWILDNYHMLPQNYIMYKCEIIKHKYPWENTQYTHDFLQYLESFIGCI